ncbi:hypothetical protein, partial [Pseudonocardia abyssalis]|uniref:hypothetical protein n=1 Tax=Pseudonocardia abyssalis TaxID=2792008 RepID=UPI001C4A6ED4
GMRAQPGGWEVHGDDVLEVEQVGVLPCGHHRAARVDEDAVAAVTVGEYGEDPAEPECSGGEPGDSVGVLGRVVSSRHHSDQQIDPVVRDVGPGRTGIVPSGAVGEISGMRAAAEFGNRCHHAEWNRFSESVSCGGGPG